MSRIEWFDIRSRRRRDVADPKTKESTLNYNVCVSTKEKNFSGMAIVDISLLSGLEPDIQELQDRAESTEKYIERYDLGAGKVFLYFNRISKEEDCVIFRAKQIAPIGLVQPANAVIYDYYNPRK
ncbi:CO3 protein, partial [Polyodon spathula]|nr:CO3 protein [Polyodon spathula]